MYPLPVGLALIEMLAERPERKTKAHAKSRHPSRTRRRSLAFWRVQLPVRLFD